MMNKKVIHSFFLFTLFFTLSCVTKAGWYNIFGSGYQKIEILETNPPKNKKYKILGEVRLNKFQPPGAIGIDCLHYNTPENQKTSLFPALTDELKAEAYDNWKEQVNAVIGTKCYTLKVEADVCECHRKGNNVSRNTIFPGESYERIKKICQCNGKLVWKRKEACVTAYNCKGTAIAFIEKKSASKK